MAQKETSEKVSFNADLRKSNADLRRFIDEPICDHLRAICENLRSEEFFQIPQKKGLTLLELVITATVIIILSTLALVNYTSTKEPFLDKEVFSALRTIQAGQKAHSIDNGTYYPSSGSDSNIDTINRNLGVLLTSSDSRYWDFTVKDTGCVQATRRGSDGRSWFLVIDSDTPSSGTCP